MRTDLRMKWCVAVMWLLTLGATGARAAPDEAPETFIDSAPPSAAPSRLARFTFRASTAPVTYQCTLDGEALACRASLELLVDEGMHVLTVSAVDAEGRADASPASWSWTVDIHPPPAPTLLSPPEGAALESAAAFALSGTAEPGSTVTLVLGGRTVTALTDTAGNWSQVIAENTLRAGSYRVTAGATDAAGNVGPNSTPRAFTVLDSARTPDTVLVSGPPDMTPEHDVTFTFRSPTPGATFECALDGAAFTPCASPLDYRDLARGEHSFQVRARDERGVVDATPETRAWSVGEEDDTAYLGSGCSASGGRLPLVLLALGVLGTWRARVLSARVGTGRGAPGARG